MRYSIGSQEAQSLENQASGGITEADGRALPCTEWLMYLWHHAWQRLGVIPSGWQLYDMLVYMTMADQHCGEPWLTSTVENPGWPALWRTLIDQRCGEPWHIFIYIFIHPSFSFYCYWPTRWVDNCAVNMYHPNRCLLLVGPFESQIPTYSK